MSKEIAQTVRGPKIAWLLAIVAAFAVLATLGTQWRSAEAVLPNIDVEIGDDISGTLYEGDTITYTIDITVTGTTAATANTVLTVNFDDNLVTPVVVDGVAGLFDGAECAFGGGNVLTCTDTTAGNHASGTIIVTLDVPDGGDTVNPPALSAGNCQYDDADAATGPEICVSAGLSGAVEALDVADVPSLFHVDDNGDYILTQEVANNVRGSRHTACMGSRVYEADGTFVDVLPYNVALDGGAPNAISFTPAFSNQPANAYNGPQSVIPQSPTASDVTRFEASTAGNSDEASCFSWYSVGAGDQIVTATFEAFTIADPSAVPPVVGGISLGQVDVLWAELDAPGQRGLVKEWNVLEDSVVSAVITTPAGSQPAITSTQNLNVTPNVGSALNITLPLFLNPNGGYYDFNGTVTITDMFGGSHVNSGGQPEDFPPPGLVGVNWTVTADSDCGSVSGPGAGVTALDTTGLATGLGFTVVGGPNITVSNFSDCVLGDEIVIEIRGSEGALGSGTGLTVIQRVVIDFTIPAPTQKQVFLAWAGQRIILEHDWRIAPGDVAPYTTDGPTPAGFCPFDESFTVDYVKGSGPGNFLTGLGAQLNGSDHARVVVAANDVSQTIQNGPSADNDIPGTPNGNCISRVLFESEDQGQVDIEAFVNDSVLPQAAGQFNVTKHAFVIYYMKLNTVTTSLVTQAEKPTHNGVDGMNGTGLYSDWAGVGTTTSANPWNSSLDDADNAAEWNVSKDILARVRVTGWFLTTNPSGRPADTSNPLNVLPANRWVMPDDWAQLNGGPIDAAGLNETTHNIGTAEEFRGYYDLMIAPNNAAGLALTNPNGTTQVVVGVVAAGNAGTGSSTARVSVVSCDGLPTGLGPVFVTSTATGTNLGAVVSCVNNTLQVVAPAAAAIPAGSLLVVNSVPFEGPYSLIDILGLAAQNGGNAGAALSDFVPGSTRDTTWQDGDVDAWDAPMPPAEVSIKLRGTGFLKPVIKSDVYYLGTANTTTQTYPNPYYIQDIPDSPFIPAIVVGSGYLWNTWGNDGPGGNGDGVYRFWQWAVIGTNANGVGETLSAADLTELAQIATFHGAVARDAVVYTDNHGEAMIAANGDFKTDLTACATNALAGGKHCKQGDKVGTATITATADYPDFVGKHFPVLSNAATVDWLWGGYKDVTVHPGETDQFKYVVFHALDRDGFCGVAAGRISLHGVLTSQDATTDFATGLGARYNGDPKENVDFLIDSGEGIIIGQSGGGTINDGKQFATGVHTFSTAANNPATSGLLEFPLSPLAAEGAADECQSWIKVSNSLLGIVNVLTIAHDDEGNIGFDRVIDLSNTMSYTLDFRWSLITWAGADGIAVADALKGTGTGGKNPGGNDISASVSALYGWNAAAQQWLGYFPSGVNVPGANDLTALNTGDAYWIAITGPSSVTWTIATNIN